ncbi:MAG TPA: polysaccharide biosynthesis/export family protein [Candidatus Deferrimicrobiaceae bacterium]|nr:polysaccharide biosynthesis/export family protein [Candidatus Deferrimicrobiaceae bacterium]
MRQLIRLCALLVVLLAASVPALAQTPAPAPQQDKDYIIGPEDILEIQVWGNKDLNQAVFVRPDGRTSLPLVGEIGVAGKTVQQLQDHLTNVYEKTVKGAVVTVIVREIKSRPIYFIGGFGKPGVMQLTRELTLLQAISVVGGVSPNADAEKGFVLRGDKRIPIDFNRLVQRGDLSQNPKLEPGDSVVVPLADAVYVNGEVKTPGAVKYTGDLTILKALTQVGGLTPLAAGGRVDVLRGNAEKKERIRVDVDKMMRSPDENPDIRLQPNDIVFVPQRLF